MLESIESIGHLRFSDLVPYNEDMLSSVTDTNVDIVRQAMKIFVELGLLEILENNTIFIACVPDKLGKESGSAERVRAFRENQKLLHSNEEVTKCNTNKEVEENEQEEVNEYPIVNKELDEEPGHLPSDEFEDDNYNDFVDDLFS